MKKKMGTIYLILFTIALITISTLTWGGSLVAAPIFTGNAPADFVGPNVVKVDDPSSGVGIPDVGLPNSFPPDRPSGWEMNAAYFEYDNATDTMFVGIDCFEICGDDDGDGDPGNTGPLLDELSGTDLADFGGTESFTVLFDTDNDCDTDPLSAFEVVVGVPLGADINAMGAYTFLGTQFSPSTGFGDLLNNEVTLFANPSAETPDIEFSIANFSTLPGTEIDPSGGLSFQVNIFMGSLADDGIGEDYLPGAGACVPIVPPPPPTPTNTPTNTPPPPTDTPVPPTPTMTPTMPPTETPTTPPTETPTEVPPTMLPPTGPNAQELPEEQGLPGEGFGMQALPIPWRQISPSRQVVEKDVVPYGGPAPLRISIGAIDLDSEIKPLSWYYTYDRNGNRIPQWNVVDHAVGWHINSAHVGNLGNVVMSGHNTIGGSVFQNLSFLKSGDSVSVWGSDGAKYTYVVDQVNLVREQDATVSQQAANAKWLTDFGDERLTLISCWPDDSSEYRVVVVAHPLASAETALNQVE